MTCENLICGKEFKRKVKDISPHNFCSRSCAAIINNNKFPRKTKVIRRCFDCNLEMNYYRKYCSVKYRSNALTICKDKVIKRIKKFHERYRRIPVKQEMWRIYKPARKYFGSWNKAIEAAGFDPNPVLFAKHQMAKDGHMCDSLAEKIIDDYLFEKAIFHERNIPYPAEKYSADFRIGITWIEYFGLAGEHKRYDELMGIKLKIARRYKLNLIKVYPKDLYPRNKLEDILGY